MIELSWVYGVSYKSYNDGDKKDVKCTNMLKMISNEFKTTRLSYTMMHKSKVSSHNVKKEIV